MGNAGAQREDPMGRSYDHTQKIVGKLDMVSLNRFRHLQMVNKRLSSKMAYYQTVIRRDRAIIDLLKLEHLKNGRSIDVSHMKVPNFRLKYLTNPEDVVMQEVDAQEVEAYSRIARGEVVNPVQTNFFERSLDDLTFVGKKFSRINEASPSKQNSYANNIEGSSLINGQAEKTIVQSSDEQSSAEDRLPGKKQIAVKSSRGGLKFNFKFKKDARRPTPSTDEDVKPEAPPPKKPCLQRPISINVQKAVADGLAFANLRKKAAMPRFKPGPKSSKVIKNSLT